MPEFYLAVFRSGNDAALAQRELREAGLAAAMMPTPRALSRSCGLSLRLAPQEREAALRSLLRLTEPFRFYAAQTQGGRIRFQLLSQTPEGRRPDTPG